MSKKKPDELTQKIDELTQDLQRVHADFQNYRRRSEEDRGEILDLAKQEVIIQLLPLLDNIDRALGHLPAELKSNEWAKGVERVAKQVEDTLKGLGVEKIEVVNRPFDPNLHEAVSAQGDGHEEIVSEELQPGYKIGHRVIRHAMVKVERR